MNLSDDKNILLAKKAVYAEQLSYYSRLCKIYQKLALEDSERNPHMTPEAIEKKYSKPLSMIIASTDLEQTLKELSEDYVFPTNENASVGIYIGKKFTPRELELFRNFAQTSSTFQAFQVASEKLNDISEASKGELLVKDGDPEEFVEVDLKTAISDFHSFMQNPNRPKTVQNFDSLLSVHSPRYIGSRYYLVANRALSDISQVDQTHIPLDNFTIKESLTPENFGAIISGYKTISGQIEELEESDYIHTRHYDPENWDLNNPSKRKITEAQDEFDSVKGSITEKAFVAGSSIKNNATKLYSAHKGTAKKALLVAAAVAAVVIGAGQIAKDVTAHNLDINSSTEYKQTITDETKDYINSIIEDLGLQSNSFDPQYEDAKNIENNIDLVLDYVVRDQVTTAFEDYHQGWKVTDVTTWFDKRYQGTGDDPGDYQFVDVSYLDENGKEGLERITNFKSQALSLNPLSKIFELEENIDLHSPVWEAFNNNGTKSFLERAQGIDDVFQYLADATNLVKRVAAFDMEHGHSLLGTPYLKSTIPEKNDDEGR